MKVCHLYHAIELKIEIGVHSLWAHISLVAFYTKHVHKITDLEEITTANHKQHIMNNETIYN